MNAETVFLFACVLPLAAVALFWWGLTLLTVWRGLKGKRR